MSTNPPEMDPIASPPSSSPGAGDGPVQGGRSPESSVGGSSASAGRPEISSSSFQAASIPANAMIGGNRIIQLLGVGGMGQVWLGEDPRLDRSVAIKTMRREYSADSDASARFLREARAVARLNHTNVIQIFQAGEEAGILYFVMEYVRGESLGQRLKRETRLDLPQAAEIVGQIALGLAYAAAYGVIHRDIKPANIMLDSNDHVKLTDFGLAKILSTDVHITQTGTAMGSPGYMSPEIAKGEPADHRADIYSLGITFYQMLMGELPFIAPTPVSMMLKHVQEPLPEPPALQAVGNGTLMDLLRKMTAKHPANRFRDYRELIAGLKAVAETGVFGPHFHLPSTRSIPEPASPYPTPVLDGNGGIVGDTSVPARNATANPTSSGVLTPHSPTTVGRITQQSPPAWDPGLVPPPPRDQQSSNRGDTIPRAAALPIPSLVAPSPGTGQSAGGVRSAGKSGGKNPASDALDHLQRRGRERSALLFYGALVGVAGLLMLVGYALFSGENGFQFAPPQPPPLPVASPTTAPPPSAPAVSGNSSGVGTGPVAGNFPGQLPNNPNGEPRIPASPADLARIQTYSEMPWHELRNRVLTLMERLEVDQARTMLQDLQSVPGLPPHVPGFIQDMGRYCDDLVSFRREFIAAARKPGDSVMIASLEYGQLTLISGNDTSLLFNNIYRVPIQLQPSQLTHSEITNLAQLLVSAGNQIPSLPRYREFLARRNEIMSGPPPSRGGANNPPDGRGQRRPPTLPPPPQRGAGGPGQQRPGAPR